MGDGNHLQLLHGREHGGIPKAFHHCADGTGAAFEACTLDFIPYRDGAYYIFDKEGEVFLGKFFVSDFENAEPDPAFEEMEFSGAAVELDWNWEEEKSILSAAKERKVYAVCHNWRRAVSFFKIPELAEYAKNIMLFSDPAEFQAYFHQNTAVYLPKIVQGGAWAQELSQIINQEHAYRLTPEGRNTDNVLLTIGIPTHDRGKLLLKGLEHLRQMSYDAEIEIAISKNGTHYYQEEYKSVEQIPDARIHYIGYDKEITMAKNWHNVVEMAKGKFVLLVSDEDNVIIPALEHYLKFLSSHENLGLVRSRTVVQYFGLDQDLYCPKGKSAFLGGFLMQNYLSGVIYNRSLFLESNLLEWSEKYRENPFYAAYPHMWWQVLLSFKGDYAVDALYLIQEGESILAEETLRYREDNAIEGGLADGGMDREYPDVPVPSTYENRLLQFQGGIELIKDYFAENDELKIEAWFALLTKTLYLMKMVRNSFGYKREEYSEWIGKTLSESILALNQLGIEPEAQKQLTKSMLDWVTKNIEQFS